MSNHPTDTHVGAMIRGRRKALGISQQALADRLGVSFQQVQKYERGDNRISASKMYAVAHCLSCPTTYFFDGLSTCHISTEGGPLMLIAEDLEVVRLLSTIPSSKVRRQIVTLARALAAEA